jgi:DNA-binding CsgD family transcriptional regulator
MSSSQPPSSPSPPLPELRPTDAAWYTRLGQVARAIGTDGFHQRLLRLFGSLVGHESAWIIRYSRHASPDVLFTSNVPARVLESYLATYHEVDPFSRSWKEMPRPGVTTLHQVLTPSKESEIYDALFRTEARFTDEMAMFFPAIGHSCMALFLQRTDTNFSAADEAQARLVFPALEGLHRAHMGRLFYALCNTTEGSEARALIKLPTLILDRAGVPAYTSRSWREAERADPSLRAAIEALQEDAQADDATPAAPVRVGGGALLRVETFDRDFPLAPGGRILVLERVATEEDLSRRIDASIEGMAAAKVTRREREILSLILRGRTTGEIAQELRIGKGTVKNYRLRLYRKANVTSERALVSLLMPALSRPSQ